MKANTFHAEMIEQRGDNDMGNIILHFFETDDEYGTRLGVKEGIMSALALKQEDLDFLLLTENENGIDSNHFYKSEFIQYVFEKIEANKAYLLGNFSFPFPQCMSGITEGLEFAKKAAKEGDLILFWRQ